MSCQQRKSASISAGGGGGAEQLFLMIIARLNWPSAEMNTHLVILTGRRTWKTGRCRITRDAWAHHEITLGADGRRATARVYGIRIYFFENEYIRVSSRSTVTPTEWRSRYFGDEKR